MEFANAKTSGRCRCTLCNLTITNTQDIAILKTDGGLKAWAVHDYCVDEHAPEVSA